MARGKRDNEAVEATDTGTHEVEPMPGEGGIRPSDNGGVIGPPIPAGENGRAVFRRKAKRNMTDRTYWVCGRRSPGSPVQHIMPQDTIGRARKQLETVRRMPMYDGWELWTTRETRVP